MDISMNKQSLGVVNWIAPIRIIKINMINGGCTTGLHCLETDYADPSTVVLFRFMAQAASLLPIKRQC